MDNPNYQVDVSDSKRQIENAMKAALLRCSGESRAALTAILTEAARSAVAERQFYGHRVPDFGVDLFISRTVEHLLGPSED